MVKFLDVNKDIINAIFLLDGTDEEIREGVNNILEEKGKEVKKKTTKKKVVEPAPEEPKRRVRRKLFKNR